jgi:hypothetical protein
MIAARVTRHDHMVEQRDFDRSFHSLKVPGHLHIVVPRDGVTGGMVMPKYLEGADFAYALRCTPELARCCKRVGNSLICLKTVAPAHATSCS